MTAEFLRYAAAVVAAAPIAALPRRVRFPVLCWLSRLLTPLVGPALLRRYGDVTGSAADETARVLFRAMARSRIGFDVTFQRDFEADLLETVDRTGAIFATAHFPLNPLFTRWLHDRSQRPVIVRDDDDGAPIIWGTAERLDLMHPGPGVLVQMRGALLQRRIVLIAIDRARAGVRSVEIETRFGKMAIATPALTFARRVNVPLFFFGARAAADGSIVVTVRRLTYDPQHYVQEFRRHTEQMLS